MSTYQILIVLLAVFSIIGLTSEAYFENVFALGEFDRDYDGIPDELDKCPQIAETYNKFEDEDGCPDTVTTSEGKPKYLFVDTDGDGYEDRLDKCVFLPETFNGYLDGDGCPEIVPEEFDQVSDIDNDSIPDSIDACPKEQETFNEFKDGDGCPDSLEVLNTSEISTKNDQCRDKRIPVMRINSSQVVCVSIDTALKWEKYGIASMLDAQAPEEISNELIPLENPEIIEIPTEEKFDFGEDIQKLDPSFFSRSEEEKSNMSIALSFLSSLTSLDEEKVASFLSDDFIQHNPSIPGDKQGTIEKLTQLFSEDPESFKLDIKRIYVDGNFVIIHSHLQISDQTNSSIIDIFKIGNNGKIIEHWDVIQEIPEVSLNENTMFYPK